MADLPLSISKFSPLPRHLEDPTIFKLDPYFKILRLPRMAPSAPEDFLAVAGSPAYSSFRLVQLTDSLNTILAADGFKVTGVKSLYVHYVHAQDKTAINTLKNVDTRERKSLEQLLHYGDESSELNNDPETEYLAKVITGEIVEQDKDRLVLFVSPRKGTISPWSSKATSIAHVCGLQNHIKRIERGIVVSVIFKDVYLQSGKGYSFADVLYDRMTQVSSQFLRASSILTLFRPSNLTLPRSMPSSAHMHLSLSAASNFALRALPHSSPSKQPISPSVLPSTPPKSPTSLTPSPPPGPALAIPTMSSSSCSHKLILSTAVISNSMPPGRLTAMPNLTPSSA